MRALADGRKVPTGLVAGGFIAVILLTGWALFEPMNASFTKLAEQLPDYWERLQKPLIKMEQKAVLSEEKLQAEVTTEIAQSETASGEYDAAQRTTMPTPPKPSRESKSLRSILSGMFQGGIGSFTAVAFNRVQIVVVLGTVFFGVSFTLMNPRSLLGAMFALFPERHHAQALIIMQRIGTFVPLWAGSMLLGMVTIGLLVFLIMWPIFGIMDAFVLGLTSGVLEAIPFLGQILSAVPALLLAFGVGGTTPLWVLSAYIAVQALENNIILPFIIARSMKLHPVAVIFSMLLCVVAFGMLGVLVAAPLVAIVEILHDELYRKRFLPTVTDADLDRLAASALREKPSVSK
ncbi:hypothetical protein U14_04288 [Candidatus Moduliflexus flocculans]|uniref:Permease n=1 Tax=Candidatus Moduliflexus flocculans TaxID=1499966 RepID=A0A0S6W085_9BACT|nr:hypothetical protein U14_04288 [Candidatus Moduliflexus flocculans]